VERPAVEDDHVTVIVSWPEVLPLATVPIQISWRFTVPLVSFTGPDTLVHEVALPPVIDETLIVDVVRVTTRTRRSPTAAAAVRVSEVSAVPVTESRLPTTVIATVV
jgi:hypothetical protein